MKELSRKTFWTIFSILSAFLLVSIVILYFQNYRREEEGIRRNLHGMQERKEPPEEMPLSTMRIMNYEVYTVELSDGSITRIVSHGETQAGFDCEKVAKKILKTSSPGQLFLGNLLITEISYEYLSEQNLVIVHHADIREKLRQLLFYSIVCLVVLELLMVALSKVITGWITRPAKEAFIKQREFIADASHELKTPLAVIMASADELTDTPYADHIRYEAERMSTLIAELLDLSKLEEGVMLGTYQEENLSKIVERGCLALEGMAFEQGVRMDTNIEENLMFSCAKSEMEKLLSTLLDNAILHSYTGTCVVTTLQRQKGNLVLSVVNEGDPIAAGEEERIFERFYRADKSRNRAGNRYGLGLAIARRIVENHGGKIRAWSENGKTTFQVIF
ncbi:His Kinase A (phospho-acceptor) domain-containing protein [Lachnospiraceae bacterium XBB1006]|nr:His Kinase A (phospho-acceptor) domain-containing protein [Lachnospiraceae bacterium XBB1006]